MGQESFTDIISFDLSESRAEIIGELYISIDRVRENAKTLHISLKNELLRVIFHGVLHLCGFRDKTRKEALQMRKKENEYLDMFNRVVSRDTVSG